MAEEPLKKSDPVATERKTFSYWKSQIDAAQKDKEYKAWLERADKIIKRYRDERSTAMQGRRRFNILWSNTQTLKPAVFSKTPTPIVERRFMDRDPAARLACEILERALKFQIEVSSYRQSTDKAVIDYLLPGMGQTWIRYEPSFEQVPIEGGEADREGDPQAVDEDVDDDLSEASDSYERLAYEKLCDDYVFYKDFLWGPARTWNDVPWVARRSYLTRAELEKAFGDKGKKVTLDYTPDPDTADKNDDRDIGSSKKAQVWEIWNKENRTVIFIAPGSPDLVLKEEDDPLRLEGFWPCPEPMFASQTNDTIVPVPDYVLYQDQAQELDDLTDRINKLTRAIKASGVYDASVPQLRRLLQEGLDNQLIPVDQWAALSEKGGVPGAISLLPMREIIEVLLRLYEARAQVKNDLFEITGMSDIVRGASEGGVKSATEQRIKGQYASMRLQSRQEVVAFFCRNKIAIMAEIIAEVFSPQTLMQMSGYEQRIFEAVEEAVEAVQPPQPPQGQPLPPEQQQQLQAQFEAEKQRVAEQTRQEKLQEFEAALEILRSDKLRGFRIDIETDSTIQADAEMDKGAAVELFSSTLEGLGAAGPIVSQAPELLRPIGDMLMFAYRRFRVGRTMEAGLEEALTLIERRMESETGQPKQPSPDEIKAQLEQKRLEMETAHQTQKMQMEQQRDAQKFAIEQQRAELEIEVERQKFRVKQQELALREREIALQERELAVQAALREQRLIESQNANALKQPLQEI